jgi:hypothetical protein
MWIVVFWAITLYNFVGSYQQSSEMLVTTYKTEKSTKKTTVYIYTASEHPESHIFTE